MRLPLRSAIVLICAAHHHRGLTIWALGSVADSAFAVAPFGAADDRRRTGREPELDICLQAGRDRPSRRRQGHDIDIQARACTECRASWRTIAGIVNDIRRRCRGMPMVILVCACAAARHCDRSAAGQHRQRRFEVLHLCSSLDFLLSARKWLVNAVILPHCLCKTTKPGPFVPPDRATFDRDS